MRVPTIARLVILGSLLAGCGGGDSGGDDDDDDGGPTADAGGDPDAGPPPTFSLELVTAGVEGPVFVTSPPGDARLFVVSQAGRIEIVEGGVVAAAPFLDVSSEITATGGEQGLLGLAFHPDYASNGRFFVDYTATNGDNTVAEYARSADDAGLADPASHRLVLAIPDFASNHNAGMIAFGPDGYLYVATGDGGGGGDPSDNGQDVTELLGKILRIDVDSGDPYGIPADNPLVASVTPGVRKEIWHTGLRNPWRWSFDRELGDMWIGDVGQGAWEEVDHVAAGEGGHNFGWSDKEGLECYDLEACEAPTIVEPSASFTDPVAVYPNPDGSGEAGASAVVGGYVYRGADSPSIAGWYFYADTYADTVWALDTTASPPAPMAIDYGTPVQFIASFGEDAAGELYVVSLTQGVFRLRVE